MSSESAILQLLGSIPANAITLPKLVEQLQTRNLVIPFVGAGMSVPFGYPQWGEFLLKTAELVGKADIESVKEHLGAGRYEEAAELLIIALEQRCFNDQMESYFGDEVRKSKILSGAILQLPRLGSGPVITTNFDGLLEEAFRSQGHPFELVVTGSNPGQAIGALQQDRGVFGQDSRGVESPKRPSTDADRISKGLWHLGRFGASPGGLADNGQFRPERRCGP